MAKLNKMLKLWNFLFAGSKLCPVECFTSYVSKLNTKCAYLFQRPKKANYKDLSTKTCWYDNIRIGKNTMGTMMSSVSKAAKLSKKYTNHSIRATCVTILDSCDFDARHIMSISKHKSESSIRSYSSRVRDNKRKDMSRALSQLYAAKDLSNNKEIDVEIFEVDSCELENIPPAIPQSNEVEKPSITPPRPVPLEVELHNPPSNEVQTSPRPILSEVQVQNVHSFNLPGPNFQHCQVNFTYNVYQTSERP